MVNFNFVGPLSAVLLVTLSLLDWSWCKPKEIKPIGCLFCSPLEVNQYNYANEKFAKDMLQVELMGLQWENPQLDSALLRQSNSLKSLAMLESSQQVRWYLSEFESYLKAFAVTAKIYKPDQRKEFIQGFDRLITTAFPDRSTIIPDPRISPMSVFAAPYFMLIENILDISDEFFLDREYMKDLIVRTFQVYDILLESKVDLFTEFDLIDLEQDYNSNKKKYEGIRQYYTHILNARFASARIFHFQQDLEWIDDNPDSESALFEEAYLKDRIEHYQAIAQQHRSDANELEEFFADADSNEMFAHRMFVGIVFQFFYGARQYGELQPLIKTIPDLMSTSDPLALENTVKEIVANSKPLAELNHYIYPIIVAGYDSSNTTEILNIFSKAQGFIESNALLTSAEADQAITARKVYDYKNNFYYYLKGIGTLKYKDLHNPPFQICRKLLNQFEQNFSDERQANKFPQLSDWNSRVASPPETTIYLRMLKQKNVKVPAQRQQYQARSFLFLKRCSDQLGHLHYRALAAANAVYKLEFTSSNSYKVDDSAPLFDDYQVEKVYGHNDETCKAEGIKAFQLKPKSHPSSHRLFAIAGTEFALGAEDEGFFRKYIGSPLDDVVTDLHFGVPQVKTKCAKDIIQHAAELLNDNTDVIFTGHSLGGAMSQALGYLAEKTARPTGRSGQVHIVSWNGFGAKETLELYENTPIDNKITERLLGVTYFMRNDLVSKIGTHFLETRRLQDKVDIKYLKGVSEHMLGVMNKSIVNDFFQKLDYTVPAQPKPNVVIDTVGDFWFDMKSWYQKRFGDD